MRASIIIAAHNEGQRLWRTVRSCEETTGDLDCEVLIVDDASTDGSIEQACRRYPRVRLVSSSERRGASATKDLGARESRGEVLVFLDGHCKPEPESIARLISDIEDLGDQAIVTPQVPHLDCDRWTNSRLYVGFGGAMDLLEFGYRWIGWGEMRPRGPFYESPAFVGCCLAISRALYEELRGFDRNMLEWGVEDADLSLKAWLTGRAVLNDPRATIGHRFQGGFDNFSVADESVLVNQLRTARKNFTDDVWEDWLRRLRSRKPPELCDAAWDLFRNGEDSVETEREYLRSRRVRDEFWYAERFELEWPLRPGSEL